MSKQFSCPRRCSTILSAATRFGDAVAVLLGVLLLAGCGTNARDILYQAGSALGRTYLDQLLTDIANDLAAAVEEQPDDGEEPDDSNGDDGDTGNDNGGGSLDDLVPDAAAGEAVYTSKGCGSCHCADAAGNCALSAPTLQGIDRQLLDDVIRGSAAHLGGKPPLSDQELVDMAAWLASLGEP